MEPTKTTTTLSGQWCLVTVRRKRELFLKYLNNSIEQKQLQKLILEVREPQNSVYADNVLLRISNYAEARSHLQQIELFSSVQRIKPNEVSRMLNK